jgi:hypothetical protein
MDANEDQPEANLHNVILSPDQKDENGGAKFDHGSGGIDPLRAA